LEGGRLLGATHWDRSICGGVEVVDDDEDEDDEVEPEEVSFVVLAVLDPEAFCCD
jgi:hypothetical protein